MAREFTVEEMIKKLETFPKDMIVKCKDYYIDGEGYESYLDYDYTDVKIDGEKIFLYNEESCRVYNMDGNLKFNGQLDFAVSCIRASKKHMNSMIVAGGEVMKELKLK